MNFSTGREMKIINGDRFFVHRRIISAVKRVEFVSDRLSYSAESRWLNIIFKNVHAPSEEKVTNEKIVLMTN